MLDATAKRAAFAAMDDAARFRLEVLPQGTRPAALSDESVVHVLTADTVDAMRAPVKALSHLARTFFGDKLTGVTKPPATDGAVSLYVICELAELDADYVDALSDEGAAPAPARTPSSAAPTLKLGEQETLRLPEEW
jgi:hypothetical protein